jgi:hypothetical protein
MVGRREVSRDHRTGLVMPERGTMMLWMRDVCVFPLQAVGISVHCILCRRSEKVDNGPSRWDSGLFSISISSIIDKKKRLARVHPSLSSPRVARLLTHNNTCTRFGEKEIVIVRNPHSAREALS